MVVICALISGVAAVAGAAEAASCPAVEELTPEDGPVDDALGTAPGPATSAFSADFSFVASSADDAVCAALS